MKSANGNAAFILYLVCISAFFASLNQNIYSPIIPLIRDSFHVSMNLVNLSVSLFIFVTAIMQMVLGPLVDRKGARFVLIPAILLTVVSSIGCAVTNQFSVFLLFRVLQAAGTAALPLVAAATIGRLFQGSQRGKAMGTYQMLLSVAPAVAPVLGGWMGDWHGYPGIFWFLAIASAILLVAHQLFFPKDTPEGKQSVRKGGLLNHYGGIFTNRTGGAILILSFLFFFVYFAVIVYLPVLLTDHYHASLKLVGLLYLPLALSTMAGSAIFTYLQARIPLNTLSAGGHAVAAGSILLFAVTHSFSLIGMFTALVMYGICVGVITPLYSTMMANEFEHNRGSAMGLFNFIRYMGMAAGPVVSGWLLAKMEAVVVFGLLGVLFALLSWGLRLRMRPQNVNEAVK
ncbi:MFS transporter [Brevibacillus sedimenti]|uniref:MFS transporter n=1 Tax=Brevibacillus sedimenti TaxID=2613334 RepID=UPI000E3B3110|nr:MFS transporter [Anoxybacillus sediminis]REK62379.1 MAG: MFS transporter [Brevibacillus sp.]UFJ60315.1 MFS transporter [Anoxybacillus sediminis]